MRTLYATIVALLLNAGNQMTAQTTWATYVPSFPDTIGISDLEVVNANIIWAVGYRVGVTDSMYNFTGDDAYFARTTDGGVTWTTGKIPIDVPYPANLVATDGGTALISGLSNYGNALTLRTTDGGLTWNTSPVGWDAVVSWPNYAHAFAPAKMTVIGDPRDGEFEIYTTGTAGLMWDKVAGANIPDPVSGEFGLNNCGDAVGNTIWFGTSAGRVYRSKNQGFSWEAFQTPAPIVGTLAFSDANNGVINSADYPGGAFLYRTADGGQTWENITPFGGSFRFFGMEAIPNSSYLLIGITKGGLLSGPHETWTSPDRGSTWQQIVGDEMIAWPTFLNASVGWAGEAQQLSHPTRLFKYSGSPLVGLFSPEKLDAEVTLSPNPASDFVHVQVTVAQAGDYWILLNDAQGCLVYKEVVNADAMGFEKTFTVQGLPPGVYTLTVTGQTGSITRQVSKQ